VDKQRPAPQAKNDSYFSRRLARTKRDAEGTVAWLVVVPILTFLVGFALRAIDVGTRATFREMGTTLAWTLLPSLLVFVGILLLLFLWRVPSELAKNDADSLRLVRQELKTLQAEIDRVGTPTVRPLSRRLEMPCGKRCWNVRERCRKFSY
jgi:hypothetical protein